MSDDVTITTTIKNNQSKDVRDYLTPRTQQVFDRLINNAIELAGPDVNMPNMVLGLMLEEMVELQEKVESQDKEIEDLKDAMREINIDYRG